MEQSRNKSQQNLKTKGKTWLWTQNNSFFPSMFLNLQHFRTKTDSTSSSQVLCLILASSLANSSALLSSASSCFSTEYFRKSLAFFFFLKMTKYHNLSLCKFCMCYRNSASASSCCRKNHESSAVFPSVWKNPFYLLGAENHVPETE